MAATVKIDGDWLTYGADREISGRSYPLRQLLDGDPRTLAIYGKFGQSIDLAGQVRAGDGQANRRGRKQRPARQPVRRGHTDLEQVRPDAVPRARGAEALSSKAPSRFHESVRALTGSAPEWAD